MANPWDKEYTGRPLTPEEKRTEDMKKAIKDGTFGKTPPGKAVGSVGATDAWAPAASAEARQRRIRKATEGAGRLANPETERAKKTR